MPLLVPNTPEGIALVRLLIEVRRRNRIRAEQRAAEEAKAAKAAETAEGGTPPPAPSPGSAS